jgi:hypothetical protein
VAAHPWLPEAVLFTNSGVVVNRERIYRAVCRLMLRLTGAKLEVITPAVKGRVPARPSALRVGSGEHTTTLKSETARYINVLGVVSIDPRTERHNRNIGCRLGEQEEADAVTKKVC